MNKNYELLMKRLKLAVLALTILCAIGMAAKQAKARYYFSGEQWFTYIGPDKTNPNSYQLSDGPMGCVGSQIICDIYCATTPGFPNKPDASALNQLRIESSNFTVPGTYFHGIVEMRND